MEHQTLLLSIREPHAEAIFDGTKRFELRRLRPRVRPGDTVIVYVPLPRAHVVGQFAVRTSLEGSPLQLWYSIGAWVGLSREQFASYFDGVTRGFAIGVMDPVRFDDPVPLATLREAAPSFRPPQSYHYLREERQTDRRLIECL